MEHYFSFVIPVFNRPLEIQELLESMCSLDYEKGYEVVIVEDGSTNPCKTICDKFKDRLQISYYFKGNSGPGDSRNYGMTLAKGSYFLILDSDVILPKNYLATVTSFLKSNDVACFGGPDAAHSSFSNLQKTIDFTMTSFWTTGGIRGNKRAISKFQPRSFNMGLSKEAFVSSGGFGNIHPGEDPDLVIRLWKHGFGTALIPDAQVYHKRRISWQKFHHQVFKFGLVRPILNYWHPNTAKITYWFPSFFIATVFIALICLGFGVNFPAYFLLYYFLMLFFSAWWSTKNFWVAIMVIPALFVQFSGYGRGFLIAYYYIHLRKRDPEKKFRHLFFEKH